MTNPLIIFFGFIILFFAFANSEKVACHIGKENRFEYLSVLKSFNGNKHLDENGEKIHKKKGEESGVKAEVGLTCLKKWKRQDGKYAYLFSFHMDNVTIDMEIDNKNNWKQKDWKVKPKQDEEEKMIPKSVRHEFDKYFKEHTGFLASSNGKIYKVFHSKKEETWVTAMKKSVIEMIQTKITSKDEDSKKKISRLEENGLGVHKAHYKKFPQKDGKLIIEKKYTDADSKDNTFRDQDNHREMKLDSKTETILSKKGDVLETVSRKKVKLGSHTKKPHHGIKKYWFRKDSVPKSKHDYQSTNDGMFLNGKEFTKLKFLRTINYHPRHKSEFFKLIRPVKSTKSLNDEILTERFPKIMLDDNYKESTLKPEGIHEFSQSLRKEYLRRTIDFEKLLKKIENEPDNLKRVAKAAEYVSHFKESINKVFEKFQKVYKEKGENKDFLKIAQTLILSAKTEEAQELFLKTWLDKELKHHGVVRTLEIQKPIKNLIERLKNYAEKMKEYKNKEKPVTRAPTDEDHELALNAYLVLADAAPKLSEEEARPIINLILENINENSTHDDPYEIILHLQAIGNAGSAIPIDILIPIINSTLVHERVKSIAIQALRKRISEEDEKEVNDLIHYIISNGEFSPLVKKAAVETQIEREKKKRNGRSINDFKKFLFDETLPKIVKDAVIDYYLENGSKKAGKVLADFHKFQTKIKKLGKKTKGVEKIVDSIVKAKYLHDEKSIGDEHFDTMVRFISESDSLFLRRAWRRIRRAARRVGRAISRAARAVGRVVKNIGNAVADGAKIVSKVTKAFDGIKAAFSKATFSGSQVCLPASAQPNDKICAYEKDMVNFISRQGDSSVFPSSRHFSHEKLIGTGKVNLYAGIVGLTGTNFNCAKPPSQLIFTIAGKAIVKSKIFSKDMNIVTAEAEMRLRGTFTDHVYLKVLDSVIINRELIPSSKIKLCQNDDKKLYNKNFGNLPSFSFTVMLGPIPLSFGFSLVASAEVSKIAGYCVNTMKAELGILPSANLGISAHAALNILVAKAGVEIQGSFNYGLYPNLNIRANECKLCGTLSQRVKPLSIKVKGFAEVNLVVWKKKWDTTLFSWSTPADNRTLFEKCLSVRTKTSSDIEFLKKSKNSKKFLEMKKKEIRKKFMKNKMKKIIS